MLTFAAPASANIVPFIDTTPGPTTFVVQQTGVYDILAFGAQGGPGEEGGGGVGAKVGGDFNLTAGEILSIIVGGKGGAASGAPGTPGTPGGGGGGGTFVLTSTGTALLIAAGGGGASEGGGGPGLISSNGSDAGGNPFGVGGADGNGGGGGNGFGGAGGGGLKSAGGNAGADTRGAPPATGGGAAGGAGGVGGVDCVGCPPALTRTGGDGGVGGGGGAAEGAGGGGGFSGGGGGGGGGGAGGGGSLNTAFADIVANSGVRLGDGELDISLVSPAMSAPEPSTWAMLLIGFAGLGAMAYRRNRRGSRPAKA